MSDFEFSYYLREFGIVIPDIYRAITYCRWGLFPLQEDQKEHLTFKPPYVVVFANCLPRSERLPPHYWDIRLLKNHESIPFPKFTDYENDHEVSLTVGQRYLRIKQSSKPAYFLPYNEVLPSEMLSRLPQGTKTGDVLPTLIRETIHESIRSEEKCTLELLRERLTEQITSTTVCQLDNKN